MEYLELSGPTLLPTVGRAAAPLLIADALTAGVPPAVIAQNLGRPEQWVRRHADLVSPGVRALFASGRLRSVTAYACFLRLPAAARRDILDAGGGITVARCARARAVEETLNGGQGPDDRRPL